MATMEVLIFPNPVLRKKCEPVEKVDEEIRQIAKDMTETMYAAKGVGLAAPQVGIPKQIFVVDIDDELITVINPQITLSGENEKMGEGCLCFPELTVDIERKKYARVTGLNIDGKPIEMEAEGFLARAFQHETDHLNGVLIIDHLSKVKRDLALKQFKKLQRKEEG